MSDIYADGTYLANNTTWHEEDSPYKAALIERSIERTKTNFRTCVDVGCGGGLVASLIAERHPDAAVFGFDISPDASAFWPAKRGVTFRQENILDTNERFDLALCLDVFEHVEDYIGFLKQLRANASRFVFKIPLDMNIDKLIRSHRPERELIGHLHYFSAYTALATLKDCGYEVVDSFYTADWAASSPRTAKQIIGRIPRVLVGAMGDTLAAKLMSGYGLVVTANSHQAVH